MPGIPELLSMCSSHLNDCHAAEILPAEHLLSVEVQHSFILLKFFALASCSHILFISSAGRGVKVEDILKDDETLTSYLLRDVPLTESVVDQLVRSQIRPEQVTYAGL